MYILQKYFSVFSLVISIIYSACADDTNISKRPIIVTSTTPVASLIAGIVGNNADVYAINNDGSCPCEFNALPSDKDLVLKADMVIYINDRFDAFMPGLMKSYNGPKFMISDIGSINFMGSDGQINWHFWLDLENVRNLQNTLAEELARSFPEMAEAIEQNLNSYINEINNLQQLRQNKMRDLRELLILTDSLEHFFNSNTTGNFSIMRLYQSEKPSLKFYSVLHKSIKPEQCIVLDEHQNDKIVQKYSNQVIKVQSENWPAEKNHPINSKLFISKYMDIINRITECK